MNTLGREEAASVSYSVPPFWPRIDSYSTLTANVSAADTGSVRPVAAAGFTATAQAPGRRADRGDITLQPVVVVVVPTTVTVTQSRASVWVYLN